jgi:hypothetical protein
MTGLRGMGKNRKKTVHYMKPLLLTSHEEDKFIKDSTRNTREIKTLFTNTQTFLEE